MGSVDHQEAYRGEVVRSVGKSQEDDSLFFVYCIESILTDGIVLLGSSSNCMNFYS